MSPSIDLSQDSLAAGLAWALAGADAEVRSLDGVGVKNLGRPITQAEVARLRGALWGLDGEGGLMGYICRGVWTAGENARGGDKLAVAVTDHVNLTWRSPLTGPNDDEVGPRFPSMTGIYSPQAVLQRREAENGIIVESGVVAGVHDHEHLNGYESGSVRADRILAASSELAPVAIVAAHMGLSIAAAVTTWVT